MCPALVGPALGIGYIPTVDRPMRTLLQIPIIAAAGVALGLASNALSPHPIRPGVPIHAVAESGIGSCSANGGGSSIKRIEEWEAEAMCIACTAGFVDARSASSFAAGHIEGAIHLPPIGHADESAAIEKLKGFPIVIVYDGDQECKLAQRVAERLLRHGLKDVRVLTGAWQAWEQAGAPARSGTCGVCDHDHGSHD